MEQLREQIEIADGQSVALACLDVCNSMRHLPEGDRDARLVCLQRWAAQGLIINCVKPRPGQHRPICGLPEVTKQATEREVQPVWKEQLRSQTV